MRKPAAASLQQEPVARIGNVARYPFPVIRAGFGFLFIRPMAEGRWPRAFFVGPSPVAGPLTADGRPLTARSAAKCSGAF